ncbi:MAG TPA: PorP/SprF family type IX secretion system membrane protein [Panacibacter sp.]|nr:PorP/SprF family type IX secretion system membrane protein [Panacibacter sp.]HNP45163.1 PorP/SprF family type IX secretion system membrane protein [Panacibacter sp.]
MKDRLTYFFLKTSMVRSCFIVAAAVFFLNASSFAQDPHFSQFFEAPLLRNPSLAGLFDGDIRIQGVYRSQWGSISAPYETGSFNLEYKQPIGKANDFITTGLQVLYDRAGTTDFTTTNVYPAVNYHKALNADQSKFLSLGFMGGYVQKRFDRSKMTTNSQYDGNGYNPSLPDGELFTVSNFHYWDGSFGMSYNSAINGSETDHYFVGLAYHHFNRPLNSFYKNPPVELNPKLVASVGVRFTTSETSFITIQADYSQQGNFREAIGGMTYSLKVGEDYENPKYIVHLGGYVRWKDAFIPVVKIDYKPFSVSMSYDANISQLKTASQGRGGFEVAVSYAGFLDRNNTTKNAVVCPRF